MHTYFPSNKRPNLLVLLLALLLALCLFGCRTKKSVVDREEKSVSELHQNDIRTSEKINTSEKILRISSLKSYSFEPDDSSQSSQVIYKDDTLTFKNAKIRFGQEQNQTLKEKGSTGESSKADYSRHESESKEKKKKKDSEVQSASWGLNLGILFGIIVLIIIGYIHFRTK